MRRGDTETRRRGEKKAEAERDENFSASERPSVRASPIDWQTVRRVLVVRLRSIGDTVLSTPSLVALRRFLPAAQIDVLLEDWVAPLLEGFDAVDNVLSFKKDDLKSRLRVAAKIRRAKYDVAFNLHGGTTATFFVRASGARHRVGYRELQYNFLYNHLLSSAADFWQEEITHSAEQQLALLGFVGVPVEDKPKTCLAVTEAAENSIAEKLARFQIPDLKSESQNPKSQIPNPKSQIALLHPVAAFDTKQWATENFARAAEFLHEKNLNVVAVATKKESAVLDKLKRLSSAPIIIFDDLTLPEITALAARARVFVGNDSGVAHIAAAVRTPSVVVFGSSNINHWRPWTDAPHAVVYEKLACQPCAGYFCKEFGEPKCILSVKPETVFRAIENVLSGE
jgi:lipopolysaccharide heptosyltransferase II